MGRLHLVELEDLPWFPRILRDPATDYLRFMVEVTGHARALAPRIAKALRDSGRTQLVDLCSGGGGPLPVIVDELRREGIDATAVITDFFPNAQAMARTTARSGGRIRAELAPVDATHVPAHLRGLRTIFNGFHHFRPDKARRILADAFEAREPIAVFEIVAREPIAITGIALTPIVALFVLPFVKPFRWSTLFFTYVLPLLPLLVGFDGVVSCLRVYSPDELRGLVRGLEAPDWQWEIGRLPIAGAPTQATFLVGRPIGQGESSRKY